MESLRFLKAWIIVVAFATGLIFIAGSIAQAQWVNNFPVSYFYTNPLYYTDYGYFNSINGYLLGYAPFTPFLTPDVASVYNLLGIPTYPYVGSPYQTTFPYTTLPGTIIPYARFDYPSYVYGSADYYLNWVLMQ